MIELLTVPRSDIYFLKKKLKKKFKSKYNKDNINENLFFFLFVYEKKVESLNQIIILFNISLKILPNIFESFIRKREKIEKGYYLYRGSYLESINYDTNPFDDFVFTISENFLFHKHLIVYLKKKLNDGILFLKKYQFQNLNDDKLIKEIICLLIYPLYKIGMLKEKFDILKAKISPLLICNDLIKKDELVKTAIIQHNYRKISLEEIEEIEEIVNYVKEDVQKMDKEITILFQKVDEEIENIGKISLKEENGFYIFQNLDFSFYKNLFSLEKLN